MYRRTVRVGGSGGGDPARRGLRPRGRPAEQLLVDVVADPADALRHEQGGGSRVHEPADIHVLAS